MTFTARQVLTAAQLNDLSIDSLTVDTDVLVVDKTNDRVGIGTATPDSILDVNGGTSSTSLRVNTTGADPAVVLTTLGQQDWSIGVDYSDTGALKFSSSTDVGTNTRMTLTSSGALSVPNSIYSPGLVVAMHEFQDGSGARSITSTATTIHSHTITTQGDTRLFFDFFTGQFIKSSALTNLFVEFYIDGTPLNIGSPTVAGEQMETNHIGYGQNTAREFLATIAASTLTLSAGTHTVRVDVSAYNTHTITLNYQGTYRSNRFRVYEVCV